MPNLFWNALKNGIVTQKDLFPDLPEYCQGFPDLRPTAECKADECSACISSCPTQAISLEKTDNDSDSSGITLDLGSCIGCGLCVERCPTSAIERNLKTKTAVSHRADLLLGAKRDQPEATASTPARKLPFRRSLAIRVVSTGCSACDLEVSACGNPIFDMERFGVQVVASPRAADALLITGPVGAGMREPLLRTYRAMAEPRVVIACGTCAISGGLHKNGYTEANGVDGI
ncbi:MAG TPA: 4Fe-4S dicluster domain-containing protein, partial [Chroococcales cyanobacterium]